MFALSWSVRPIRRRLLALATLLLFLASMLPRRRDAPAAPRALAAHTPTPTTVTHRRQPPVRARLPRRLGPGLRRDAPDLRRRTTTSGRAPVTRPGRHLRVQGRAQRRLGRELRRQRRARRRQHRRSTSAPPTSREVLLLPRDPLGHRQRQLGHRDRPGQLPVRARLPRRLGSRTACAPGSRTPTATAPTPSRRPADPGRHLRGQGRPQRELGRQLRRRAASRTAPTSRSPSRPTATVTFSYDATTHVLTITTASLDPAQDNNVEWDGLRHDSRDTLYRTPGGAVPAGTAVTLRLRTFHDDVTGVKVRFYSVDRGGSELVKMTPRGAPAWTATRRTSRARPATSGRRRCPADFGPRQPLVPLRRHRRHRHRLLRRRHRRARRRPRRRRPTTRSTRAGR